MTRGAEGDLDQTVETGHTLYITIHKKDLCTGLYPSSFGTDHMLLNDYIVALHVSSRAHVPVFAGGKLVNPQQLKVRSSRKIHFPIFT
jgi:hypothetical protein